MKQSVSKITAVFATGTAFLGSCCALPLLLLGLGVGSAGLATALAPFRPYMIGITVLLLGIAFYTVYGCKQTCEGEGVCDVKSIRRTKILLWAATGLVLLFLVGPGIIAQCILS
ncbi:mercury transporter MerT [Candidatus Uhrbacteria bacterium]|nr:mercury transporter MerT [Candidatus Uhrbacteria bacterium]